MKAGHDSNQADPAVTRSVKPMARLSLLGSLCGLFWCSLIFRFPNRCRTLAPGSTSAHKHSINAYFLRSPWLTGSRLLGPRWVTCKDKTTRLLTSPRRNSVKIHATASHNRCAVLVYKRIKIKFCVFKGQSSWLVSFLLKHGQRNWCCEKLWCWSGSLTWQCVDFPHIWDADNGNLANTLFSYKDNPEKRCTSTTGRTSKLQLSVLHLCAGSSGSELL